MVVGMSLYSQIREASTSGGSQRFIAKRLGISRQTRSTAREQQCVNVNEKVSQALMNFAHGKSRVLCSFQPTKSACSAATGNGLPGVGQPLSRVIGRKRYNTLDFADKVVCHETAGFIGFFLPRRALPSIGCLLPRERCPLWIPQPTGRSRPHWKPRAKGICHPFGIPARFEMGTHKWKMVCGHSFQNAKIPQAILYQRGKSVGFSLPHA